MFAAVPAKAEIPYNGVWIPVSLRSPGTTERPSRVNNYSLSRLENRTMVFR